MQKKDWVPLLLAVGVCELAGILGSIFTAPKIDTWYADLVKPELTPPGWVFGPVWTTLFALMGVSAFLIWKQGWNRQVVRRGLMVFGLQLVLNFFWSVLFFGLQNPAATFVDILVLWLLIAMLIAAFARISRPAAYLLVPYLLWVTFATYLNYAIWRLN